MMATGSGEDVGVGFVHEAMPYRDQHEYVDGIVGFVRTGLAADLPVLVVLAGPRGERVRDALGAEAASVQFGDMRREGLNPGRITPVVLLGFAEAHPGRRLLMVSEPLWPERLTHAYPAVVQHEALVNLAFAGRQASMLCPYDVSELPAKALVDAERTHPMIRRDGGTVESPRYTEPRTVVEEMYEQQRPPPPEADVFTFTIVSHARQVAHDWAARAGLPADRVTDLLIAISEIGGNSVVHGRGGATLFTWTQDDWLVCEIRDQGHIADPLAGQIPPDPMMESGRGLLMVNHVCDLVQVTTRQAGTAIRLWMKLPT